jgi:HSP20 family protein
LGRVVEALPPRDEGIPPIISEEDKMLTRFMDVDRTLSMFDELSRQMDRTLEDLYLARPPRRAAAARRGSWFDLQLNDTGEALVLTADVPGVTQESMDLTLTQDLLTLKIERPVQAPKGYEVHRKERSEAKLTRSFALPCRVDPEKVTARLENGVLTLTMQKAADARPRKINVVAG